mgnify:CR=1 FL=1
MNDAISVIETRDLDALRTWLDKQGRLDADVLQFMLCEAAHVFPEAVNVLLERGAFLRTFRICTTPKTTIGTAGARFVRRFASC